MNPILKNSQPLYLEMITNMFLAKFAYFWSKAYGDYKKKGGANGQALNTHGMAEYLATRRYWVGIRSGGRVGPPCTYLKLKITIQHCIPVFWKSTFSRAWLCSEDAFRYN
jgi:hypothetical protein